MLVFGESSSVCGNAGRDFARSVGSYLVRQTPGSLPTLPTPWCMDGGLRCPERRKRRKRAKSWARGLLRQLRLDCVYDLRAAIRALRWLLAEAEALLEEREALAEAATEEASGAEGAGIA